MDRRKPTFTKTNQLEIKKIFMSTGTISMIVAGPNVPVKDYHYNETEELFLPTGRRHKVIIKKTANAKK
jgi:hypothetical protein